MQTKELDSGKFDFVGKIGLFGGISVLFVLISVIYLAVHGVTYGIDFRGGTELQVKFGQKIEIAEFRKSVESADLGEVGVQTIGDQNELVIRFQGKSGKTDKETNEILNASLTKLIIFELETE